MNRKNLLGTVSLILIGIVFGAVLVSGFGWVRPSYADVQIGADKAPVVNLDPQAAAFNNAFIEAAEKVTPSIVQITVVTTVKNKLPEEFHFFFPFKDDIPREQQGGGSGIVISEDGYILTNNHVVEDAKHVTVTLHDKREFEAEIVGTDPLTDLAVIKINAKDLPAAYLGDSDNIKVGQWVMAIGNPLSLASTVTAGIISAKSRNINIIRDQYAIENFIQTDAAINPGNSGGALVDLNGAVIGVNSAIATDGITQRYIGYGFAIPINLAKAVARDLIANGKVSRGYIGVQISELDAQTAKAIGLDEPKGVLIQDIVKGGAAEKADIKQGDVILKIDEKEVNVPSELQSYVASKRAGDEVKLTLYRDGKKIERYVKLKARDEDASDNVKTSDKGKSKGKIDKKEIKFDNVGMTVRNMTEEELKEYKVGNGVLVTEVKNFSKAYNQRIIKGVVITEADKKPVKTVSELEEIFNDNKGKAVLLKLVDSQGNSRLVGLEIPEEE
ncbi:Trypsin-like serine protease [Melioribacter roseus P3M-2]|uniref:Trypsin-like serine protease n=1 Tax=Melioribacter roseus (strain DSM 23840 / JCM 17771 / VKM B-2668 / P3M-2) TaxID=1191523 RepID=I6ZUX3_MELRP|nr:Do family serine endopeptidase [Melioribacter roseus]AFN75829.1 Trypsin-like serine protease [Melioribacter roseus P3M-2]